MDLWQRSCIGIGSMEKTSNNDPQQPKIKSKKLIVITAAAVVFLVLGGGGYWYASGHNVPFLNQSKKDAPGAPAKDAPPIAVFKLHNFVVNLADPDHSAFLRIGIALGLDKQLPGGSDSEKDSPYTPQVRDAVLSVLSTWSSGNLLAPDGKTKLKKELLDILQQKVPEMGVINVYFTDFLIQQ